jgi:dTDP-4-dehydrorhamnose 3,5-epimerase
MKFKELEISGVWVIDAELVEDARGVFRRHFCANEFAKHGIETTVAQGNVSENPYQHTLRGFHYQMAPHAEGKTLSCFSGSLYDIVVDLRPQSRTYGEWISVTLTAASRQSLYVPPGCANAYLTMDTNTLVHYYMSSYYNPESYRGFHYADPSFEFIWPCSPALISEKDNSLPMYAAANDFAQR